MNNYDYYIPPSPDVLFSVFGIIVGMILISWSVSSYYKEKK